MPPSRTNAGTIRNPPPTPTRPVTAWRMIVTMLTFQTDGDKVLPTIFVLQTVITISVMLMVHWFMRERQLADVIGRLSRAVIGLVWGVMLMLIIITQGGSDAFIYFQF